MIQSGVGKARAYMVNIQLQVEMYLHSAMILHELTKMVPNKNIFFKEKRFRYESQHTKALI